MCFVSVCAVGVKVYISYNIPGVRFALNFIYKGLFSKCSQEKLVLIVFYQ